MVFEVSEIDGHDCWGNYEYTKTRYVIIDGKREDVYEGMYVIHDGKKAIDTGFIDYLDDRFRKYLDENLEKKLKELRKKKYLELKEEFEKFDKNDPFKEEL